MSWNEFNDSPTERIGADGIEVVRMLWGPWDERLDLLQNDDYVTYPDIAGLTVQNFEFEPWVGCPEKDLTDRGQTVNKYPYAKVTITYATPQDLSSSGGNGRGSQQGIDSVSQDLGDGSFYTMDIDGQLQVDRVKANVDTNWETIPVRKGLPFPGTWPVRVPFQDIKLTRNNWGEPDWDEVDDLQGKVNQAQFEFPVTGIRAPKHTVLFNSYSASYSTDFSEFGVPKYIWNVTYHLQYRWIKDALIYGATGVERTGSDRSKAVGWNHFIHPAFGLWDKVKWDRFGNDIYYYPDGDFNKVF